MTVQNHTDITLGAPATAAVLNGPLGQLDQVIADVEAQFGDFVVLGGLAGVSATLTAAQPATRAFIGNYGVTVVPQNLVMTASKDNYVDLDNTGIYHITPVNNGAAAPVVFASSIRLYKAVTSATAITSVADLRQLGVIFPNNVLVKGGSPWWAVEAFGADPTGQTVTTTPVQTTINTAHNSARGAGVVFFGPGVFATDAALQYWGGLTWQGCGMQGIAGGAGTSINMVSGADVIIKSALPGTVQSAFGIKDMTIVASANAANTGGLLLTKTQYSTFERIYVGSCNLFCIRLLGGNAAGDTAFNNFNSVVASNVAAGGACVSIQTDPTGTSIAEGSRWTACRFNSGAGTTGVRIDKNGSTAAADATFLGCNFEQMDTFINSDGNYVQFIGCRFEVTAGNSAVILNPTQLGIGAIFIANTFAVPGTLTWTDNGTQKSPRIAEYATGNIQRNFFPTGAMTHSVQTPVFGTPLAVNAQQGDVVIVGALTANLVINAPTNPTLGQMMTWIFIQDGTGSRTVTWNAVFKTAWLVNPSSNMLSSVTFVYDGTSWQQMSGPAQGSDGSVFLPGLLEVRGSYIYANGGRFLQANSALWDCTGAAGTHTFRNNNGGFSQAALDANGALTPNALAHSTAITLAAAVAPDLKVAQYYNPPALIAAAAVAAPLNPKIGEELVFQWQQDATGGRVVTYNAAFKTTGVAAFVTTLSTITIDRFIYDGAVWRITSRVTGQVI